MNLVIHELLVSMSLIAQRHHCFFELLIGGSNQSHKVNFKELPFRGKISMRDFSKVTVNTFFEKFSKKEPTALRKIPPPITASEVLSNPRRSDGSAEGAISLNPFKLFLSKTLKNILTHCHKMD